MFDDLLINRRAPEWEPDIKLALCEMEFSAGCLQTEKTFDLRGVEDARERYLITANLHSIYARILINWRLDRGLLWKFVFFEI